MTNSKIDVCIPTYRRPSALSACLVSLLFDACLINTLYIFVTGKLEESIDIGVQQIIRMLEMEGIRVVITADMKGLVDSKAAFMKETEQPVVLFLDDDAVLTTTYLVGIWGLMAGTNASAVSGSLITPINVGGYTEWSDTPIPESQVQDEKWCNLVCVRDGEFFLDKKYQVHRFEGDRFFRCQALIGTALLCKKDDVEIDMNYQLGSCAGEEIDFTYRMYKERKNLFFTSKYIAYHNYTTTGGNRGVSRETDSKNWKYFGEKWGFPVESHRSEFKEG